MKNKYKVKRVIIIAFIIIIIGVIILCINPKKEHIIVPDNNLATNTDEQKSLNNEKLFTEKYIGDNIKTIATNKPVLGGSWYVVSVVVNPVAHIGEVTYEDGHIQSTANFIYTYSNNPQSVVVTKWEVIQ